MIVILINPPGLRVRARKGQLLDQVIRKAGIELTSHCNGLGRCGKCRILVTNGKGAINEPTKVEQEHLTTQELSQGFRLACQVKVQGSIEVNIPDESIISQVRLQVDGQETPIKPAPLVKKYYIELLKPTLQSQEPDWERLQRSLQEHQAQPSYVPHSLLRSLPEVLRKADWKVTATVWGNKEILDVDQGDTSDLCYGISVDVGTTKIACCLVNLITGDTIETSGMVNPQIVYGEDLMSRITYGMRGKEEREELQRKVIEGINRLITRCRSKNNINPRYIYEATVACNTAMHHLLLGISPEYLALAPYVPAIKGSLNVKAKELNIDINPEANVHFLPAIGGFVGADCVADILSTGLFKEKEPCLLLDIGTNTEIVIGNCHRMLSCSCASGPAFEGGHIKHGMQAMSGAIESVIIEPDTLKVSFKTIDNGLPKGICGSGIIDCITELLKAGAIDRKGVIKPSGLPCVRINQDGESEFIIVPTGKAQRDIVVTQRDIGEFQLAKAAVHTGAVLLMQEMNLKPEQLKRIYIAGAFGTHINPANAIALGMIPDVPLNTVVSVGNAAITGAKMTLLSSRARKICEKISSSVEYLELAAHPGFQSVFMESLRFPELNNLLKGY